METTIWICLLALPLVHSTPTFLGCFNSSFVRSDDFFLVPVSIPSVECLGVCGNRLTRYAGIQSLPTYDYCFCGNDLLERSSRVDNSSCAPCSDVSRMCGSNKTVALYKLRDSTPAAVLLATPFGVEMFQGNTTTVIIPQNEMVTWVDFSYTEDTIFFRVTKEIISSSFSYLMLKYITAQKVYSSDEILDDLAVDWINKKLLYVEYIPDKIKEIKYDGTDLREVFDNDKIIRDLHIDPYYGALFFIDDTHFLHTFLLQNNSLQRYNSAKSNYYSSKKIALDIHKQVVYMVVLLDENSPQYLVSTVYGDTKTPTVLFNGPELTDARALDVFDGDVYWVNYNEDGYSMYRCHLTPRCQKDNLIFMYHSRYAVYDIRVFHPYKQTRYGERTITIIDSKFREDDSTHINDGTTINTNTTTVGLNSATSPPSSEPKTRDLDSESITLPEEKNTSFVSCCMEIKRKAHQFITSLLQILLELRA